MAQYNLIRRTSNGVVAGSPGDFYNQLQSVASQSIVRDGKTSYPIARLTTRASSRAKVASCTNDACVFQEQRVRIEITGLAAGTTADRQELMRLLMTAASEAQALIKGGAVIGYAPTGVAVQDNVSSVALNMTGAVGVSS